MNEEKLLFNPDRSFLLYREIFFCRLRLNS